MRGGGEGRVRGWKEREEIGGGNLGCYVLSFMCLSGIFCIM